MYKVLALLLIIYSSSGYSCAFHNLSNTTLIGTPEVQDTVRSIVKIRKKGTLGNKAKPDHFKAYAVQNKLDEPYDNKMNFAMLGPISRHYSYVDVKDKAIIKSLEALPGENDLLVITELEILDALAVGTLSWSDVKAKKLIVLQGTEQETAKLEQWFAKVFYQ